MDRTVGLDRRWTRVEQLIVQTLVVAFMVVMVNELPHRATEGTFAYQDEPFDARLLDGPHEPFRERIRFGDRGGKRTGVTPPASSVSRTS